MHYEGSATIQAAPETIWSILTDAPGYPEWNTYVERIEGTIAHGRKLKVFSKLVPGRGFPVRVTRFEPGRAMTWSGGMPLGLFKGVRTFALTPQVDGTTHFAMREVFSGPMLGMITKRMPDLSPSFEQWAAGLKERAEAR